MNMKSKMKRTNLPKGFLASSQFGRPEHGVKEAPSARPHPQSTVGMSVASVERVRKYMLYPVIQIHRQVPSMVFRQENVSSSQRAIGHTE